MKLRARQLRGASDASAPKQMNLQLHHFFFPVESSAPKKILPVIKLQSSSHPPDRERAEIDPASQS